MNVKIIWFVKKIETIKNGQNFSLNNKTQNRPIKIKFKVKRIIDEKIFFSTI